MQASGTLFLLMQLAVLFVTDLFETVLCETSCEPFIGQGGFAKSATLKVEKWQKQSKNFEVRIWFLSLMLISAMHFVFTVC